MNYVLEPITLADREEIIDIFNFYTENSFAAYTETPLPYEMFDTFIQISWGYPSVTARNEADSVIGFGMLRPYSQLPAFSRTAELTCFIRPGWTGRGIGRGVLEHLEAKGREMGIATIIASISSLNEGSIRFHLQNGFRECGRFVEVGVKKGMMFDVVYCQKML
jgi:phosphinothricin acetyltransferase